MAQINAFFNMLHEYGGSDLHLSSGSQPLLRLRGQLTRIKYKVLEHDELKALLYEITPEAKVKEFEETGDVDFAHELPGVARYRVNYFMQHRGISAVFREIPQEIMSVEQLGLPERLRDLAMLNKGLVLVTGPTGSGKSTTLAAIIDYANKNRRDHILTIEDPIEFVHQPQSCLINQREVGRDTDSFKAALRGALREDPDIILVGEMRDLETIRLAMTAAETGHLVFGTLHTSSAAKTVDRIIDVFPAAEKEMIRAMLSESIRAVISQTLCKTKDGTGRIAAHEIMIGTPAIRNLIREAKVAQMYSSIQTGQALGMQTLDQNLMDLVKRNLISNAEARSKAANKDIFIGG